MKHFLSFISITLTVVSVYIFFAYNNVGLSFNQSASEAFSSGQSGSENQAEAASDIPHISGTADSQAKNTEADKPSDTLPVETSPAESVSDIPYVPGMANTLIKKTEADKPSDTLPVGTTPSASSSASVPDTSSTSQSESTAANSDENQTGETAPTQSPVTSDETPDKKSSEFFKAFWVATVYGLDYPSAPTTDSTSLMKEADEIISFAANNGYNAIILQVRPAADSLFNSQFFPWSEFLTGKQGKAPDNGFDPLKYWTEQAHKRGIELHAWLNPYRVTKGGTSKKPATINTLAESHPARQNPEWLSLYSDGNLYFNPGIPEVRKLILDSIDEIIENYDVDGIHFDDYFYPGQNFNDGNAFSKYGSTFASVEDFRRSAVNSLIKGIHDLLAEKKPNCVFGISPFGIWANKSSNQNGSDTNGTQSYYDHFADTRKWVKEGWIDYIAPQLYWNIGNASADYDALLKWWLDVVSGTDVKLYIGHAAYRAGNQSQTSPWYGTTEIINQLSLNEKTGGVRGSIFFRYKFLKDYSVLTEDISAFFSRTEDKIAVDGTASGVPSQSAGGTLIHSPGQTAQNTASTTPTQSENETASSQSPVTTPENTSGGSSVGADFPAALSSVAKLNISRPSTNISTSYDSFYIAGSSDPNVPLYINGEPVTSRSSMGFFGVLVSLKSGKNTITVSQGENSVTRTITKGTSSASVTEMKKAGIPSDSTFPQSDEYRKSGEKITLKCSAPAGSKVEVKINGQTYQMSSSASARTDGKVVAVTYKYIYIIPQPAGGKTKLDLGIPKYTAVFNGKTYTQSAKGNVVAITNNAPIYATVIKDIADTYKNASSSGGADNYLYKGMCAQVTGMTGEYVRLSHGCWIKKHNVKITNKDKKIFPVISDAMYSIGEKYDTLSFKSSEITSAIASLDKNVLTLKIAPALKTCAVALPENSLLGSYTIDSGSGYEAYAFTLRENAVLDGFYLQQTDGGFTLFLKRRPKASDGDLPLRGISIVLDAGHGGNDNGALGCMGTTIAEKHTNFNITQKLKAELEKRGAKVIMTRTDDTYIALQDRQAASFAQKPDLFLSIHANSLNDNVDISKITGYSVYYKNTVGEKFAQKLFNGIKSELNLDNRGIHTSNLYVARASWTPSVILETAFIPNPSDFQWLIDSSASSRFAASLADIIVQYFS